jgi:hypothetical protein
MAVITLDKKEWMKHLGQFGDNLKDLKLVLFKTPSTLGYSVAFQTYYLSVYQQYPNAVTKGGEIIISDLNKLRIFLKKCTGDITFKHMKNGRTLYVSCGSLKMNLPVTDIISTQLVPTYEALTKKAMKVEWEIFGIDAYTLHAKYVDFKDILTLSSFQSLVKKDSDFVITANAQAGELAVSAGKAHDVKVFATTNLTDVDGPEDTVSSNFGSWLLPCLGMIDESMDSNIHFGNATGLVVEQSNNAVKRLLIIIDQQE